ncbi:MAG: membrane protein insertase YidC [Bdellovibrionales bacterium]|jgi:YidC/Oxa1 family membrane protein insertase|nr:membrane protein insertase YidC [Bdellovibrionales bacterium]
MGAEQKRAFLAVVLSGIVLFTWQFYFAPKAVKPIAKDIVKKEAQLPTKTTNVESTQVVEQKQDFQNFLVRKGNLEFVTNNALQTINYNNPETKFSFESIGGNKVPFEILVLNPNPTQLFFNMKKVGESEIVGKDNQHNITINIKMDDNGKVLYSLNSERPYLYRFKFNSKKDRLENNQIRQFMTFSDEVDRFELGDKEVGEKTLKWFGIDFNHHIFNFVHSSKIVSRFQSEESGTVVVDTVNPMNFLNGYLIFTEKNYDKLVGMGDNLHLAVDFGIFGIVAVPILRGLQFFYKYLPNYGIAIILLTILIRMITFPLQYKSFKSMKKMQTLQPELTKLKEKHKDNPQRMQKETMELFKRAGANPLGGCLPLLLQMPIFFAFYKVLYEAVELVGAPFYIWIHDLSQKDPYYILPVLMAISMVVQQKVTPTTTTDPAQKKIMMIMPIVFGFIMKDLPSGLVLYIFVSTVFGMLQQMFVYKVSD